MNHKSKIVVLGSGESGTGTALLAKAKGYNVFVSDKGEISSKYKKVLQDNTIEFEEKQHTTSKIDDADVVMKSPGIPDSVPLVKQLRKTAKVISEIEFASEFTDATCVAITGSNGKTTTAKLTHHILKQELKVGLGGNIGDSFALQVLNYNYPNYVLEVSSFQLDDCYAFNPKIAVITNITPDHLDRYDYKLENYVASKFRIVQNHTEADYLI